MTGNLIGTDERVDWGDRSGRGWVEASKKTDQMVHIDLDLEGEVFGNNPSVDIDFTGTAHAPTTTDIAWPDCSR